MDITYCHNECSIGKAASDKFLESNNSAYDAAIDFWHFTDNCFKNCPHKAEHVKRETESRKENI